MGKKPFLSHASGNIKKAARPLMAGLAMVFTTATEAFSCPEQDAGSVKTPQKTEKASFNITASLTEKTSATDFSLKEKKSDTAKARFYAPAGTFDGLEHKSFIPELVASVAQRDVLILTPASLPFDNIDAILTDEVALKFAKRLQDVLSAIEGLDYKTPPFPDTYEGLNSQQEEDVWQYAQIYGHIRAANSSPKAIHNVIEGLPIVVMPDTKEALVDNLFLPDFKIEEPDAQARFRDKWSEEAYLFVLLHELVHIKNHEDALWRHEQTPAVRSVLKSKNETIADIVALQTLTKLADNKGAAIDKGFLSIVESWRALHSVLGSTAYDGLRGGRGYGAFPSHNTNGAYNIEGDEFTLTDFHDKPIEAIAACKAVASYVYLAVFSVYAEAKNAASERREKITDNTDFIFITMLYLQEAGLFDKGGLEYQLISEYLEAKELFSPVDRENEGFKAFYAMLEEHVSLSQGTVNRQAVEALTRSLKGQLGHALNKSELMKEETEEKASAGGVSYIAAPSASFNMR